MKELKKDPEVQLLILAQVEQLNLQQQLNLQYSGSRG